MEAQDARLAVDRLGVGLACVGWRLLLVDEVREEHIEFVALRGREWHTLHRSPVNSSDLSRLSAGRQLYPRAGLQLQCLRNHGRQTGNHIWKEQAGVQMVTSTKKVR